MVVKIVLGLLSLKLPVLLETTPNVDRHIIAIKCPKVGTFKGPFTTFGDDPCARPEG
jgi:hypothetical protein